MRIDNNNVVKIIDKIADELYNIDYDTDLKEIGLGLMGGVSGIALFFFYYSRYAKKQKYSRFAEEVLSKAFNFINKNPHQISCFYADGITGIYATLLHLQNNKFIDNDFFEYDRFIDDYVHDQFVNSIGDNNIDFFYGAAGLLFFLYIRYQYCQEEKTRLLIIDIIEALLKRNDELFKIFTSPKEPTDYVEISIPHGLSSWLLVFSKLKRIIPYKKIDSLLCNLFFYYKPYIKKNNPIGDSFFPEVITPQNFKNQEQALHSRLGWCYGDLPSLLASLEFAEVTNNKNLKTTICSMLEFVSKRLPLIENHIFDAGICHGSSGLSLIFKSLYHKYDKEYFHCAAIYWQNTTIKFNGKYDIGYSKAYMSKGEIIISKEYGFLEGISGIGLSLLSVISKEYTNWKELLLI